MAKFEKLVNSAETTLNGAITNVQTTITVTSATAFPTDGNFRIIVNNAEIMLVTAVSGAVFTVTRGIEGTSAIAASNLDTVKGVFTSGSIDRYMADRIGLYGEKPAIGSFTDGSGNILEASDFSWFNQGTASITTLDNGIIRLDTPIHTSGTIVRGLQRTGPSTPYTITAGILLSNWGDEGASNRAPTVGVGFRNDTNQTARYISIFNHYQRFVGQFTNNTTSGTDLISITPWLIGREIWFKAEHDGTDLKLYMSNNGIQFQLIHTANKISAPFGAGAPDKIGIFTNTRLNVSYTSTWSYYFTHWSEA